MHAPVSREYKPCPVGHRSRIATRSKPYGRITLKTRLEPNMVDGAIIAMSLDQVTEYAPKSASKNESG
jgi:hypothetical protein